MSSGNEEKIERIANIVKDLRDAFRSNVTRSKEWRMSQLEALKNMIHTEEKRIYEALRKDLRKPEQEAYSGEFSPTMGEIKEAMQNLSSWMSPVSVSTALFNTKGLSTSTITYQPLGVVLILSAWNIPFNLLIGPLVGAIAAGNCALLKPSEVASATSALFAELIPKYMDNKCIKIIEGGVFETTEILKLKFNHIFYTGNAMIGRVIMRAAAEHLCPVTLELGGKNPCMLHESVDMETACRRILWAKLFNCGQTCLSIDYMLVKKEQQDVVIECLKQNLKKFLDDPKKSKDLGRIINKRHVQRIGNLLKGIDASKFVVGGPSNIDEDDLYIPPTIIKDVPLADDIPLMQEEIFGPVLPIVPIDDWQSAIDYVNSRPHPLAVYIFTNSNKFKTMIAENTTSGSIVCNDALTQFAQTSLPFGGVGESGIGSYHGKKSFLTFSHERSMLDKSTHLDLDFRYPPYSDSKLNKMKYVM